MATEIVMPALGMAQESGILVNWFKAEGEAVSKGEPLMEVETDKATVEIEAPASGILAQVSAGAGDQVPVGQRIAVILAPGEAATATALHRRPLPQGEGTGEGRPMTSQLKPRTKPTAQTRQVGERIPASPAAKRIAKERGVDLASVTGSGPGGSVVAEDVVRAADTQAAAPGRPPQIKETTVPLTTMRRIVGERMTLSKQTAPHFYASMDVDMTEAERQRAKRKEQGGKIVPSINDLILSACARALKDFPSLNSELTDQGVKIYSQINIGVAVAVDEGLLVPIIRNADRLSVDEIARQSRELADKAQNNKLLPCDYEGGTFTVSNLGMFGVDRFVAIINPPQCAILAVGQVAPRVVPYGEGIAIRSMMTMTLSADHRIVDGVIAARFLHEIKGLLEKPTL